RRPQRIQLSAALLKGIHCAGQEVKIRILARSPVAYTGRPELTEDASKVELTIALIHVVFVELGTDKLTAKSNLMLAADPVDVVGIRKRVHVEGGRRAGGNRPLVG